VGKLKMNITEIAPTLPATDFKRTKILVTLGPATNSYGMIFELIKAGANGMRLNFSHGTYDERRKQIEWIRKASREYGKPIAIVQDLQGPKIRLGEINGVVPVQAGQNLRFKYGADYEHDGILPLQIDLSKKVKRGERLYLFDGKVKTTITSVQDGVIFVRAENDGILISRKGVNLPDTDFKGEVITKKDRQDLVFGAENDVDYVAQSYVQVAEDVRQLKRHLKNLGSQAKVIAKIETRSAADNIEEIIEVSDMVMIARGDLAIEAEPERVPILQRQIIELGQKYSRPTIVATQMMASLIDNPEPTRAEVNDVATAVLTGADCLMLSDETATGKYPVEAVSIMKKVIRYAQDNMGLKVESYQKSNNDFAVQNAIASTIIDLSESIRATAIVAETKSGATALKIASFRPKQPILVVASSDRIARQLAIVYGTKSFVRKEEQSQAIKLTDWLKRNKVLKNGDIIVSASGRQPGVVGTTDTIKVRSL
jgi:pyruvate kinase